MLTFIGMSPAFFDDGATLSGWFDINQYGFIANSDLTASDGSTFAGAHYVTPGTSTSNTATSLSYFPNLYVDGMTLNFAGGRSLRALGHEHATPGGINELFDRHLHEAGMVDAVTHGLDKVFDRLAGNNRIG
jgi:hypothetical protein